METHSYYIFIILAMPAEHEFRMSIDLVDVGPWTSILIHQKLIHHELIEDMRNIGNNLLLAIFVTV